MRKGMDTLKLAYDLLLDSEVPGLSAKLKLNPKAYEVAFKYWLDKTTDEATQRVKPVRAEGQYDHVDREPMKF